MSNVTWIWDKWDHEFSCPTCGGELTQRVVITDGPLWWECALGHEITRFDLENQR